MNDYIGTIKLFAGNFAPAGWRFCDGITLIISEYQDLYDVIGTTYGGDGKNFFAMPDLRGRVPVGAKTTVGKTALGQQGGEGSVSLTNDQAGHTHNFLVSTQKGTKSAAEPGSALAAPVAGSVDYELFAPAVPGVQLNQYALGTNGGNLSHDNMQPYLGINFIICYQGMKPSGN